MTITGGQVTATGYGESAGIGGGEATDGAGGEGANVNITGGLVIVNSAHTAIGHGGTDSVMGHLTIAENMKVYAGNNGTNYERDGMPFTAAERAAACQYRHCSRIELCDHPLPLVDGAPVTAFDAVTESGHARSSCVYCGFVFVEEAHDFDDTGVCRICGYNGSFARVSFDANGASGEAMNDVYVAPGGVLTLPECVFTAPDGQVFGGWRIGNALYKAGDWITVTEDVTAIAQWAVPVTITYDANGGSGTMAAEEAYIGQMYSLPPCGFDAPAGMEFSVWEVYGEKKLPLDEITVTEDTAVKALWVLAFCTPDFVLPDDLETIEDNAFEGAAMMAVEISGDCEYIGAEAFKNCKNLIRIYVPEYCELGENVFEGCVLFYIFGTEDSPPQNYCDEYKNCVFVEY